MASDRRNRSSRTTTKNGRGVSFRRRSSSRPVLELLEDRAVPSTVYWTGAQDNNWDNPVNWSSGSAPTASDDVIVNQTGANLFLYNFSGTPDTIHSLSVQATDVALSLQLGTLDLSGGASGYKGPLQATQPGDAIVLAGA